MEDNRSNTIMSGAVGGLPRRPSTASIPPGDMPINAPRGFDYDSLFKGMHFAPPVEDSLELIAQALTGIRTDLSAIRELLQAAR